MLQNKANLQKDQYNICEEKDDQKLSFDGKIITSKIGWLVRISMVIGISGIMAYNVIIGIQIGNPLIVFSVIFPFQELVVAYVGWFFYRNPAKGTAGDELVSVLVPIFNQESMISTVIAAIANSTYKNIEIIAINDGSTDGTKEILDNLKRKYHNLTIIHNRNSGKRYANFVGFAKTKGNVIVFIDSDSILDKYAIEEFMKTFHACPDVGAVVGHAKVLNAEKNLLTKIQDSWYDSAFNIVKTTESKLGNVICCSGCLSAYRRSVISNFIPLWNKTIHKQNINKETKYYKSNPWKNKKFALYSKKILEWVSQFDDAEDIGLTAQTLVDWKTMYVSSAKVYTDVPENMNTFLKQQIRWKKGWIRAGFFLMTFFWKKDFLTSIIFYLNSISSFTMPVFIIVMFFYYPFILHQYLIPLLFLIGIISIGMVQGLDYKFRNKTTTNWKYRPIASIFTGFVLPWLIIPALLTFRKNQWLTR